MCVLIKIKKKLIFNPGRSWTPWAGLIKQIWSLLYSDSRKIWAKSYKFICGEWENIDSLSLVAFDNTCYLPSPSPSFQKGDISDGAWRWHLCDYATMGSNGWLSFVVPSATSLPESLLWSPPKQDPHSPVLESSTLHKQGQVHGSHCCLVLGYFPFPEIY